MSQKLRLTSGSDAPDFAGVSHEAEHGKMRSELRIHDAQMKARMRIDMRVRTEVRRRSPPLTLKPRAPHERTLEAASRASSRARSHAPFVDPSSAGSRCSAHGVVLRVTPPEARAAQAASLRRRRCVRAALVQSRP